ncbi:uncharacterized protein LOC126827971 [Patella vulgata]|uniref:uncharacterized protein LOC126827971 n=1 Tax=Patella vulgata TaxID=6465 RepID=UPI00217FBE24|nr:uncharacterized protein LOC126827971 [Patella vulgata]
MVLCAAVGCNNDSRRTAGISYYKIQSRAVDIQKKWMINLRRKNYVVTAHSCICSDHFEEGCFVRDLQAELLKITRPRKIKDDALPTVFNHGMKSLPTKRRLHTEQRLNAKQRKSEIHNIILSDVSNISTSTGNLIQDNPESDISTFEAEHTYERKEERGCQTDYILFPDVFPANTFKGTVSRGTQTFPKYCNSSTQYREEDFLDVQSLLECHSYCSTSISTPSLDNSHNPQTSTPKKKVPIEFLSDSSSSSSDARDTDYQPSQGVGDSSFCSSNGSFSSDDANPNICLSKLNTVEPHVDRKYIVFESSLCKLFKFCQICGSNIINTTKSTSGSLLKVKSVCVFGHSCTWNSQPYIRKMPAGNLLIAAALLYAGCSYAKMEEFADLLNLEFFGHSTYYKIQTDLFTIINEAWTKERLSVENELVGRVLCVSGDGRCDSPGFSAKYCTYSLLDSGSGKLINFSVVHVGQVELKSTNMEKEGKYKNNTNPN